MLAGHRSGVERRQASSIGGEGETRGVREGEGLGVREQPGSAGNGVFSPEGEAAPQVSDARLSPCWSPT